MLRFFDGHYIDRQGCDEAFAKMHAQDRIGDRIHLFMACFGLVCLFGPVTLTEIGFAPLLVFFFVRVLNTFPVWIHGFGQPAMLVAIVLAAWMMLTLGWSGDRSLGWGEISELRWFVLVGLLFPVIEKRFVLIGAVCVGAALAQTMQIVDAFDGFGFEPLAALVANQPGRLGGWWHPVVGGSLLVCMLGFHLPAAALGDGRWRVLGALGSSLSLVGLVATGSRGAWIAGMLMVVGALGLMVVVRGIRWRWVLAATVAVGGFALVLGWSMGESIVARLSETKVELNEIKDGQYDSYTGARVKMAQLALEATAEHPLLGVGAGGYQHWANTHEPGSGVHPHAHNSLLHISSTLGLVGVVIWLGMLITLIRASWRIWDGGREGIYGLGPMFGLIGLMLVSLTDCVQINTQTAAMLAVLAALSPTYCPGHPRWAGKDDGSFKTG